MTQTLPERVVAVLEEEGFSVVPTPFLIGGARFDDLTVLIGGEGSLELVVTIILEPHVGSSVTSTRWLIERLARALDAVESLRPLSAVLISESSIPRELVESVLRFARVVSVVGGEDLSAQLGPLLPLEIAAPTSGEIDALEVLTRSIADQDVTDEWYLFIREARSGATRVKERFARWLDDSFEGETVE